MAEEYISKHIVLDSWFDVLNKLRYILNKSTIPNGSLTEDEAISLDQASTIQTENMYNSLTHNLNATESESMNECLFRLCTCHNSIVLIKIFRKPRKVK